MIRENLSIIPNLAAGLRRSGRGRPSSQSKPGVAVLRVVWAVVALVFGIAAQSQETNGVVAGYRLIEVEMDTLPSLNRARSGHVVLCVDGELMVFGGHTDGFVPTATAEYLRDGAWHTAPLVYPHDQGTALSMRSGKVLLAGGHKDELGIGQLFSVEMYDPTTHTSQGFGCMDRKRSFANAIEMADGQVVISGNWYADDGIEMFGDVYDPSMTNAVGVRNVSIARANPYILRIADDDAIIFGALGNTGQSIDPAVIDRLKGPSYREPLLDIWRPIYLAESRHSYNLFIGNEAEGLYEWLVPVQNAETGRTAIARVTDREEGRPRPDTTSLVLPATFALLPTSLSIPDSINGKRITYSSLVCDRERRMAYLIGNDVEARAYVVTVTYDDRQAEPLSIYVTGPLPIVAPSTTPVLTPDGNLVFAGGHLINNFTPTDAVVRIPIGSADGPDLSDTSSQADQGSGTWWLWVVIPLLIACAVVAAILVRRHKPTAGKPQVVKSAVDTDTGEMPADTEESPDDTEKVSDDKCLPREDGLADLFNSIESLMQQEQLYLDANLRASDVAARVNSNTTYVSAAINSQRGCSFTQYLNAYRVAHAQELMRQDPKQKLSSIIMHSGFTTDSTFFRAFRAVTGTSPKEWLSALSDK